MKKLVLGLALFSSAVMANDTDIIMSLGKLGFAKTDIKIANSPVQGFKTVTTPEGIFYVTEDGQFLTKGPIYNIKGAQPQNIANSDNVKLINSIAKDAIVYKAPNEKYILSVFTDYTCHYCLQLHENIQQYLDKGISVHYFAFPRTGVDSQVGKNMQYIWNSADRKAAFDNAYKGKDIAVVEGKTPYVSQQFNVGVQLGITGTPALFLPNGQLISGYVPAEKLIEILHQSEE